MSAMRAGFVLLLLLLGLPASAQAGTVTSDGATITYVATAGGDSVTVGTDAGTPFVESTLGGITAQGGGCVATSDNKRVDCAAGATKFVVRLTGDNNRVDGTQVATAAT